MVRGLSRVRARFQPVNLDSEVGLGTHARAGRLRPAVRALPRLCHTAGSPHLYEQLMNPLFETYGFSRLMLLAG